jgi:hypothetical protein
MVDYSKIFPLAEYYEKVVMPIDKKYRYRKSDNKFICCLHNDKDPSLGIVKSKSKGEEFHCFGCNSWNNVVDFHMKVSYMYYNKLFASKDLAIKDLCRIFEVDYKDVPVESLLENSEDKAFRKEVALMDAVQQWNFGDFKVGVEQGKLEQRGVAYFNELMIRMVDVVKCQNQN